MWPRVQFRDVFTYNVLETARLDVQTYFWKVTLGMLTAQLNGSTKLEAFPEGNITKSQDMRLNAHTTSLRIQGVSLDSVVGRSIQSFLM